MGSQRIVSKIGDLESFGADPRRVVYAGHGVDGIDEVDFAGKYQTATGNIKERYQSFDLEYKGEENNDYVNGQGLCCTDNPLGRDGARTVSDTKDSETPEKLIYFYHSDHLGSSSLITNLDGEVTQHIEYIPYGEVFIEERNNVWNTPYLFNAKELDEETGLYYYGARYLNPMDAMWLSVDPKAADAPGWSPYRAFFCNPIRYTDPDGQWEKDANGNLVAEKGDNAYTFAKYLNTDAKTGIKMLAEQGYTVNKKGILNLKVGDVFQVENTTPAPDSREDLGYLGNEIRDRAGSDFSKNMFENYWNGSGDVELSGKKFAGVLMYVKENNPEASKPNDITLKNNDGTTSTGTTRVVNFYNSKEYSLVFGRSTLYYNSSGNIVGFYDTYDFDSKSWGTRSTENEIKTRMVRYASPSTAKPFKIRYGYSKR
jgi:RHS repeat-associated protein